MKKHIIGVGLLTVGSAAFAADWNLGGYVDAQVNWGHTKDAAGVNNSDTSLQTFRFNEGALYGEGKVGDYRVFLELDIRGPAKVSSAGFNTGTVPEDFAIGAAQSQAYVEASYDNGVSWSFGQKDTPFVYEAADSWEYRYSEAGLLASRMPVTHIGFFPKYAFSETASIELVFANTYDVGHLKQGNFDYGAKFSFEVSQAKLNLGTLVSTGDHDASGAKKDTGYLVDADLGFEFGAHALALYGYTKKADIKKASWDWGVGLDFGHDPESGLGYGLRVEFDKDGNDVTKTAVTPAGSNDDETLQVTVGPQWRFNEAFQAKLDYTFARTGFDRANSEKETAHFANLAAVYKF